MIHTHKVFSELLGISSKALAVYKQRGKVIQDPDGFDDQNEVNAAFIEMREKEKRKIEKRRVFTIEKGKK